MSLLSLQNIITHYGKIRALKGISLEVETGEIVCLIGANGAGKTTTLKTICGLLKPTQGKLIHKDEDITRLPAHKIVARGIALVPEGRQVFSRMTTHENLEMGGYTCRDTQAVKEQIDNMYILFPRLKERRRQLAGTLSGGEQQMLAIARALVAQPGLLLLDEPSMGLAPKLLESIFTSILEINKRGTTVLLVEQNTQIALDVASRGYVMQTGEINLAGTTKSLKANDMVKKTYLGMS
ncbi:MAG: ABC transporter ATP-binding protein [Anaerolineaceae bacterium]|nr:ABC transporter ATP-binding protein [Anaerolineaceae bacterium]